MKLLTALLLCLALLPAPGCGDDPPCGGRKPACTTDLPPVIDDGHVAAGLLGLRGDEGFLAYGESQVFWSTDGRSVSLRAVDPYFTSEDPRKLTLTIELFQDTDGDPPGCYARERLLPLCFELGEGAGGSATLEDAKTGYFYVTEGGATGWVKLLGTSESGQLLGTFALTAYARQGDIVVPSVSVEFTGGRFAVPRL